MFDHQTGGGQEVMNVVTEVLEKVVGINWRALVIPSVAFASSSQSFWQNDTSKSWDTSKRDLLEQLGILLYSYSGRGFPNEIFPILVGRWIFRFFYKHVRPMFTFCLCRSCYDQALTCFQCSVILQRHVYMTVSDLPHNHTHLSKLNHHN